ncbi:MAG TPA: transposase [Kofleriaceae bacterium]|nr:transposase [Kofleriaceae bacterium]
MPIAQLHHAWLKRPWPDGRTALVLPPVAFLRRLCGIIPPPRRHLVRYAGVFDPTSKRRTQLRALVPATAPTTPLTRAAPQPHRPPPTTPSP